AALKGLPASTKTPKRRLRVDSFMIANTDTMMYKLQPWRDQRSRRPHEHESELQELPVVRHAFAARRSRWRNECGRIEERDVLVELLPGRTLQHARSHGQANAGLGAR